MEFLPFLIIAMVIVMIAVIAIGSHLSEKKRRTEIDASAEDMGLTYVSEDNGSLREQLAHFRLFDKGRGREVSNIISGDAGDVAITIFDYKFVTGSGKNKTTYNQSVIVLQSPNLSCPDFSMRPQGILDWFGSALGLQDIDFETHPEFSKMFVLQSSNEEAIRGFLPAEFLTLMESKKGYSVEADRDTLIFYRARKRLKPEEIKDGLAEAYEIYHVLLGQE
jgi:hypothetical protein